MNLKFQVEEASRYIKSKIKIKPKVAIVLGSGLGALADEVKQSVKISYKNIPHFKEPSVVGHSGELICGFIEKVPVLVQKGRWHYYEGHSMNEVALPVRVFAKLGIETVILTNAAGGINLKFKVSDLMLITDQINLMGNNPLIGHSAKIFGTQFPDMTEVYDSSLKSMALQVAKENKLNLRQGTYCALTGPNYETPAEIKMLRTLGASAVGMSTVPEAMAARHCGMKVLGVSCITNMAAGIGKEKLDHSEIKEAADKSMKNFVKLIKKIISKIN